MAMLGSLSRRVPTFRFQWPCPVVTCWPPASCYTCCAGRSRALERSWWLSLTMRCCGGGSTTISGIVVIVYHIISIWSVVWNMASIFPYIGNVINPTDSHIFQRCWNHQPAIICLLIVHSLTLNSYEFICLLLFSYVPRSKVRLYTHIGGWSSIHNRDKHTWIKRIS